MYKRSFESQHNIIIIITFFILIPVHIYSVIMITECHWGCVFTAIPVSLSALVNFPSVYISALVNFPSVFTITPF